MKKLSLIA